MRNEAVGSVVAWLSISAWDMYMDGIVFSLGLEGISSMNLHEEAITSWGGLTMRSNSSRCKKQGLFALYRAYKPNCPLHFLPPPGTVKYV